MPFGGVARNFRKALFHTIDVLGPPHHVHDVQEPE